MNCLRLFILLIAAALAGCASSPNTRTTAASPQTYTAADTSRTIDLTHPPRDMWDRIRRGFAIPNLDNELSRRWTEYYAAHPEAVWRMSERAGKYLYYIVDEVNRRGLPTELALLPFVESAYDPTAYSRAHASGLWQFIPSTGLHYKLEQNWWHDQRRDPIASTHAALDYLNYLYDYQGDWYLALASYNWGEGAVRRAMDKASGAGDLATYSTINMPAETRNYVPKLQAIKNIVANPDRYGVQLPPVSNAPYFATVQRSTDMDIAVAAQLAEMSLDEFKALNPAYNRPVILSDENATLLLPRNRVDIFNANLQAYQGRLSSWKTYTPRKGETYASIAKQHGITLNELREVNGLNRKTTRAVARTLLVPATPGSGGGIRLASLEVPEAPRAPVRNKAGKAQRDVVVIRGRTSNVRTHTVRSGDTLYALARRYNTSVDALRKLNNLKSNTLAAGARLRVPGTSVRG